RPMTGRREGGTARAGVTGLLFEAGRPFIDAHLRHPTVEALQAGRLAAATARHWLEQDYLFLQAEVGVLTRLAWQAPRHHQHELVRLAWDVAEREIPGHKDLSGLFGADTDHAVMGLTTLSYTRW